MTEREVLSVADQISVACYQAGHEHCSGVLRLWRGGEGPCECACHRSSENNLGISGDAQNAEELAGRGLNIVRDRFAFLGEVFRTIDRLRKQAGLTQNRTHASDPTQVGTTGRLDVKTAQTGAQHSNERNEK